MKIRESSKILLIVSLVLLLLIIILIFKYMGRQKISKESIRQPVVAGSFYPANPDVLSEQIDYFLNRTEDIPVQGELRMLILPHAGYEASGSVAAYGFKKLIGKKFKTVVIIGPSHSDWFEGNAVYPRGIWQTPLGKVEIDADLAEKLIKENKSIFNRPQAHYQEHCLEIMLPFLQKVLKNFKIVPVIVGQSNEESRQALVRALNKHLTDDDLVIISSDLSHYPSYKTANEVDQKTIQAILTGEVKMFEKSIRESMAQDLPGLDTCACGEEAIKIGLSLAQSLNLNQIKLLKYANSGDIFGDNSRVVGYPAIAFGKTEQSFGEKNLSLTQADKQTLLKIARESIESYLKNKKISQFDDVSERLQQPQGVFVTLNKDGQLRGCIGRIIEEKEPLYEVVSEMALAAALEDPRFVPVKLEEMKEIEMEISVLSPLKKIKDPFKEIEIGKYGVLVQKGFNSGVFLPQVATENNWDLEMFMGELCEHKAGLAREDWKKPGIDIYIFSAEVFSE